MKSSSQSRRLALALPVAAAVFLGGAGGAMLGVCGPFTDVSDAAFCPFVLEIFTLGITTGTTPTTYDPASTVSRLQMAAFLSRTVDGVLKRGSRRAIADEFWTPKNVGVLGLTTVGGPPLNLRSDGSDIWVTSDAASRVFRLRASDGKLLETWTGATNAFGVVIAMGRVIVSGGPGLFSIDPTQTAGVVTTVASNLPSNADGITFDGARVWTANFGVPGSVSIITPGASIPWTVTTVTTGFSGPFSALYDGANVWVTDHGLDKLLRLDASAAILQTVTVGNDPYLPVFDGANIWVPNQASQSVSVVRASTGAVLAKLTAGPMVGPGTAAFDGERVLVTAANHLVFLWKAADLTPLGSLDAGAPTAPYGACSDGLNFWIAFNGSNQIARF